MTIRGTKPKPTELKKLAGNPGRRPLNVNEPQPGSAKLNVPRGRLPKEGARVWKQLARPLADMGVLTEVDLIAFEMLCLHYATARQAADVLNKFGLFVKDKNDPSEPRKNPAAQILRDNSKHLLSYLTEFGLTPSSRVRIKAIDRVDERSLAEILFEEVSSD